MPFHPSILKRTLSTVTWPRNPRNHETRERPFPFRDFRGFVCFVVAAAPRCVPAARAAFAPLALLAFALSSLALAPPDPRFDRVERWLSAVLRHEPGEADEAVADIGSWPAPQLRMLWIDVPTFCS